VPLKHLFSRQYAETRRPLIDMARASLERRPGDPLHTHPLKQSAQHDGSPSQIPVQDTTTCVAADRWGNVVAATPSCNMLSNRPGPSGVNQGNRVRCLNTTPGHPNRVEPGKRPRVTLTPTLVTKNGRPVLAISVAGGDLQDQTTLNVLLNHVEFGMPPDRAVTAPRFSTAHHQNSFDPNPDRAAAFLSAGSLSLSKGISAEVEAELGRRGHKIKTTAQPIGNPVMIYLDPASGLMHAAGDPAARRHAAALE
jgi:gamma-glutamyltranspeptidase/glutathione hydrolase